LESLCTLPASGSTADSHTKLQSWFDQLSASSVGCASLEASAAAGPSVKDRLPIDLRGADRCTDVRYLVEPCDQLHELRALLAWTTTHNGRVIRFTVGEKAQDGSIVAHADVPISRLLLRVQSHLEAGKTALEFIADAVGSLRIHS
jgi:hypothetical protein